MKHEPAPRRDQREIVVPGDMHPRRPSAVRRPANPRSVPPGEMRAALGAVVGWIGRTCLARPGEVAGSALALGAVAFVSANALGFQIGRHPAPILPQPALAKASPVKTDTASEAKQPEAKSSTEPATSQKPEMRQDARQAERTPAHDAIGDILRADDATGTTASVTPKPDRGVMQAQRALAKLGYATLKPDGMMGPATRTAIERFERERKLPVTGAAAGRTLRELVARVGTTRG